MEEETGTQRDARDVKSRNHVRQTEGATCESGRGLDPSPACAPNGRPGKSRVDGSRPLPAGLRRLPLRPALAPVYASVFPAVKRVGLGVPEEGGGVRDHLEAAGERLGAG